MKPLSLAGPYEEPRADLRMSNEVAIMAVDALRSDDEMVPTLMHMVRKGGRPKGSKNKAKSATKAVTVSKA